MIKRWLKGNTSASRKSPVAALLVALLAVSGLVGFAQPANAVTWGPWGVVPYQAQNTGGNITPTDTTVPFAFDEAIKPWNFMSGVTTNTVDVEFEFWYGGFSGGYGSCTAGTVGDFTCPGGITIQTTQPVGGAYTVSAALVQRTNAELPSIGITDSGLFAAAVVVTWTNAGGSNFFDTLTEVHFPADSVTMASAADQLKWTPAGKTMPFGGGVFKPNRVLWTQWTGGGFFVRLAQTLPWAPLTDLLLANSPATPSAAVPTGGGVVRYERDASSTSDCTVDAVTGAMTYATIGTCVVRAFTNGDATYGTAETFKTFNITAAPPTPGVTFTNSTGGGTVPTAPPGTVAPMPDGTGLTPPAGSGAFIDWICTPLGGSPVHVAAGTSYTPTVATTCDAQWTPYPITFGLNGGGGTAPGNTSGVITMPDSTGMTPPAGASFSGNWNCNPGGTVAAGASFTPAAATNCLPVWTPYTVNFDFSTGGGTAPSSLTGVITLPGQGGMTAPTGTAFGGWNCVPGGHYAAGASLTPTATTQCSAQWDVIHVVNFTPGTGTGTAPGNQNSPIASMPGVGTMIAPAGNTFDGWSCFDGTTTTTVAVGAAYSPAADATCTAQWRALPQVTFTTGAGSGTAPNVPAGPVGSMPDGTGMTPPAGQQFNGWVCTPLAGSPVNVAAGAAYNPTVNTTCVAQWSNIPTPPPAVTPIVVQVDNKTIVEGNALPTFTTNVDSDLASLNCGVYAFSDRAFANSLPASALTAAQSPYVIHCAYTAKTGYQVVAYSDGVLNVDQARTLGSDPGVSTAGKHKLVATYYFNGDSPKLRAATIAGLKKLAKKVGHKANVVVSVQGFVKRTAVTSYDYRLSMDRALNIVAYLKKLGVNASFSADSRGIAKENTPKARRAEVTINW